MQYTYLRNTQIACPTRTCKSDCEKRVNYTIIVAKLSETFAYHSMLSLNLPFFGLFHSHAFVLVVSDMMCVFSGETDIWAFSAAKNIELLCKIIPSFKNWHIKRA